MIEKSRRMVQSQQLLAKSEVLKDEIFA